MDFLVKSTDYFVWHPWRAFGVSLIFWSLLLLFVIVRGWQPYLRTMPLLIAASAWVIFGLHEYVAYWERANIRADLFFTFPALMILTTVCCCVWLYSLLTVK